MITLEKNTNKIKILMTYSSITKIINKETGHSTNPNNTSNKFPIRADSNNHLNNNRHKGKKEVIL